MTLSSEEALFLDRLVGSQWKPWNGERGWWLGCFLALSWVKNFQLLLKSLMQEVTQCAEAVRHLDTLRRFQRAFGMFSTCETLNGEILSGEVFLRLV